MNLEIINLQKFCPVDESKIKKVIKTVLRDEKKDAELCVTLMDNKGIKKVNKNFLKHNYATDVLSFAYHEASRKNKVAQQSQHKICRSVPLQKEVEKPGKTCFRSHDDEKKFLQEKTITGEIVISAEMAAEVAQENGYPVEGEIVLYVIHGLLHLLGYDDKKKSAAKKMHLKEKELLERFGYHNIPVPD
ncbi:MAG: rRNA maturation RNase YbeY [Candidatus Loosdrechtia sp.]|uniref:rRNA maturation RNAse YbeY n=1 Tax=Candidatus Loosdrechtia sp. TaxID=3101272 RepID=UPI003A640A3D|nr:MAG: rRNA maturation RNase YbeY [Candidatus Jettenia sp. AMX2]